MRTPFAEFRKGEGMCFIMELDAKQKVLLAIYTEYQKDLPNMDLVQARTLDLDTKVFRVALDKLQAEGLIQGVNVLVDGNSPIPSVFWSDAKMTPRGIDYVEEKLGIESTATGEKKVADIVKMLAKWGWDQGKDIAARVLADMAKGV